jgi:hypothetical protein
MAKGKHDWTKLDPLIDQLKGQGWNDTQIAKDLRLGRQTLVDHLRSRELVHHGTPEYSGIPQEHLNFTDVARQRTPERTEPPTHPGTLEEYQEVMEEVHQSVPDVPYIASEGEHLSTPIVHPEVSPDDSTMVHPGVPARQDHLISTPMVYPGTPTAEDWELWISIKARWGEVEKLLADRQALLSTPSTPGNTQKKTYVFDVRHITLIDRYAQENRLELKDVIYLMCEEFFQRRQISI